MELSERGLYYLDQCKELHATRKTFSGRGVLKHARRLVELSQRVGAASALDYGCGKGTQYTVHMDQNFNKLNDEVLAERFGKTLEEMLGYEVRKYDPAWPQFNVKPDENADSFDLVWCTDVLEHVPEEDIPAIIRDLDLMAKKALFVTVGTYPAKKTLPNGENAHITQKPAEWWREIFAKNTNRFHPDIVVDLLVE